MLSSSAKTKTHTNADGKANQKGKKSEKKLGSLSLEEDTDDAIKSYLNNLKIELDKGRIKENAPEFLKFKSKNFHMWGDIQEIISAIVNLANDYGIVNIKLVTKNIVDLATLMRSPTNQELIHCIENHEMVMEYSKKRIKSDLFSESYLHRKALLIIQKWFRARCARKYYEKVKMIEQRLFFIQQQIKTWCKYTHTKSVLRRIKENMCIDYAEIQREFSKKWPEIRTQKRIEIHVNSLGWDRFQKMTTPNFHSQ